MVSNAATRERVTAWLRAQARGWAVTLRAADEEAMIAVQGPQAMAVLSRIRPEVAAALAGRPRFALTTAGGALIARSGYTGEDGVEWMGPAAALAELWADLVEHGVRPAGLGARDTLRLEAGLCLWGHELDERTTPLEAGLGWTVRLDDPGRDFIGRAALERQRRDGVPTKMTGLLPLSRSVARHGDRVETDAGPGRVTSGSYSPTLQRPIALVRVPAGAGPRCQVTVRGRAVEARLVAPPFVRNGQATFDEEKLA